MKKQPIISFGIMLIILMEVSSAPAADLGTRGEVWRLIEQDIIDAITAELERTEDDGRMAQFNAGVRGQVEDAFYGQPSLGLARATEYRTWQFDPSVTAQRDIRTHKGKLVITRGTRINPLDYMGLAQPLLFIDASDLEQVEWGMTHQGLLILTGGLSLELEQKHGRKLYFDQKGILTDHFEIKATPARVTEDGNFLKIEEFPPERGVMQ